MLFACKSTPAEETERYDSMAQNCLDELPDDAPADDVRFVQSFFLARDTIGAFDFAQGTYPAFAECVAPFAYRRAVLEFGVHGMGSVYETTAMEAARLAHISPLEAHHTLCSALTDETAMNVCADEYHAADKRARLGVR
jgi:hypothetical protein